MQHCACHRSVRPQTVLAILVLVAEMTGCGLEKPQAPSFNTTVHIPLGTLSYTVSDLIRSAANVEGDTTGSHPVYLTYGGEIDSLNLEDHLQTQVDRREVEASLGQLSLFIPTTATADISIGGLSGIQIPPGGALMVVPPFSLLPVSLDFAPFPEYRSGTVGTGTLRLTLHNELPVALEQIQIDLEDLLFGTTLIRLTDDSRIAPRQSQSYTFDLTGLRISNELGLRILSGHSPGSGSSVFVQETDGISFDAELPDLRFRAIEAPIPANTYEKQDSVTVGNSFRILRAEVSSAEIPVYFESTIPLPVTFDLVLPEVLMDGQVWSRTYSLPSGSPGAPAVLITREPLGGTVISTEDPSTPQKLAILIRVRYAGSGSAIVRLTETMGVQAEMGAFRLALSEVTGYLEPREHSIPRTRASFDIPELTEGLEFIEAGFRVTILNETELPGSLALVLTGFKEADSVAIRLAGEVAAAGPAGPALTHLTWDQGNSPILDLLNLRPDEIGVSGNVRIGDPHQVRTIRAHDRITGDYEIRAPIRIRIHGTSYRPDPSKVEVADDLQEQIRDRILDGQADLVVRNHLPFGVSVMIQFSADSVNVYSLPDVILERVHVQSGALDPSTGRVLAARDTQVRVSLSSRDVMFFARDRFFGGAVILPDSTGPGGVELLSTDEIEVKGLIRFGVVVD